MAHLLLIEDDAHFLGLLERHLVQNGHQVETAEDGLVATKVMEQQTFEAIITDILMPGRDGLEVLRQVRASENDVPVIAISGGGQWFKSDPLLAAAKSFGARHVLRKPFDFAELDELIEGLSDVSGEGNAER